MTRELKNFEIRWIEEQLEKYHDYLMEESADRREQQIEKWEMDGLEVTEEDIKQLDNECEEWISEQMEESEQELVNEILEESA